MQDFRENESKLIPTKDLDFIANEFANERFLQPHIAFGKYVSKIIDQEANSALKIATIQEACRLFDEVAPSERRISLLYHFTNDEGARLIGNDGLLGRDSDEKIYLSKITPNDARPLVSAEDARGFQIYFKEHKVPQSLYEHMDRFVLALKFKWKHDILKKHFDKNIVPVGADKLKNVIILAVGVDNKVLNFDEHGEIYVKEPIKTNSDPNFEVFGPFLI